MKSPPFLLKYGDIIKIGSTVFITQKLDPEWLQKVSQPRETTDGEEKRLSIEGLFEKKMGLKSENSDKELCKICYLKNQEIAFVPCGHYAVCEDCALKCDYCPFCKRTDIQIMRIFKS